ncbi:hypothetical protein CBL_08256 [Carabus blaptoides fortunei]
MNFHLKLNTRQSENGMVRFVIPSIVVKINRFHLLAPDSPRVGLVNDRLIVMAGVIEFRCALKSIFCPAFTGTNLKLSRREYNRGLSIGNRWDSANDTNRNLWVKQKSVNTESGTCMRHLYCEASPGDEQEQQENTRRMKKMN